MARYKYLFLLLLLGALSSCSAVRGLSTGDRWQYDAPTGRITDNLSQVYWHFTDQPKIEQNTSDGSYGAHFVAANGLSGYKGKRFVESVLRDLPFRPDSLCFVYRDDVLLIETLKPVKLQPDYAIYADSVTINLHGEVYRAEPQQRADIVWRNILVSGRHHRLICLDRFRIGNRYFGVVYVLQSRCRQLKQWQADDWWGLPVWDASDMRNMQMTAGYLERWRDCSVEILRKHSLE